MSSLGADLALILPTLPLWLWKTITFSLVGFVVITIAGLFVWGLIESAGDMDSLWDLEDK